MSFVFNDSQQLSLFDKLAFLSPRMKKMLDASWAKAFSDHIFSKIDESIFIPLYSQNRIPGLMHRQTCLSGHLCSKSSTASQMRKSLHHAVLISGISMHSTQQALKSSRSAHVHWAGSVRGLPHISSQQVRISSMNASWRWLMISVNTWI